MDLKSPRDSNPHLLAGCVRWYREVTVLGVDGGGGPAACRFDRCASTLPRPDGRSRRPGRRPKPISRVEWAGRRGLVAPTPRWPSSTNRRSPETIDRSPLSLRSFVGSTASFAPARRRSRPSPPKCRRPSACAAAGRVPQSDSDRPRSSRRVRALPCGCLSHLALVAFRATEKRCQSSSYFSCKRVL